MLKNSYYKARALVDRIKLKLKVFLLTKRGTRLARQGQVTAALAAFREAFDLNPLTPMAVYECLGNSGEKLSEHLMRGDELLKAGREKEASKEYALAIAFSGNYRESDNLEQLVQSVASNNEVIVTQLAINYFPMFEIWYRYFKRSGANNLLVIALDPLVYKKVNDLGAVVYLLPVFNFQKHIRNILWYETVKLRKKVLDLGVNYVHSDIDAFWFQNPLEQMRKMKGDIVSSIAYGTPKKVVDAWGFVLCLGFYCMRSTEATRSMYPEYIRYTGACGHDQNGLNTLLLERGTEWQCADGSIKTGLCKQLNLNVVAVPDSMISRQESSFSIKNPPQVFHPWLESGNMMGKMEQLKKFEII